MKKIILLTLLISSISFQAKAQNLAGGDMQFIQTGANQFKIVLRMFRFCNTVTIADSLTDAKIFDLVTDSLFHTFTLKKDSVIRKSGTVGAGYAYRTYCLDIITYSNTITIPNNPNGYYGNWETCCLDTNLRNYYSQGMTWTCDIPNPTIIGGNSNPKFIITPDTLFFPIVFFSNSNFSCTDPDGDSLVYSFIQSYDTTHKRIKPYSLVPFKPTYNNPNIIGPGSSIKINKNTGIVTARPAMTGKYLIAVKCEEFRNGIKIGEVTRSFIMIARVYPLFSISKTNLNSQIKIYPNPSNGEFRIEKSNEIKSLKVEVYDIYGKIIFSKISNNNLTNINLNNLAKGIYTVKLIMDNAQTVKRIVVN